MAGARGSLPASAAPGARAGPAVGAGWEGGPATSASPVQLHLPVILLPFEKYMALLYRLNVSGGNCSQSSARALADALCVPHSG